MSALLPVGQFPTQWPLTQDGDYVWPFWPVSWFSARFARKIMPNSISAKKSLRQNHKRRAKNRARRSSLRTLIKRFRIAAEGSDAEAAETALRAAVKGLDQAAAKGLIHKNAAARTKSRLSRRLAQASAASAE